jgi:hypothetical protein
MRRNLKKLFSVCLILMLALMTFIPSVVFGADDTGTSETKKKPFPSESTRSSLRSLISGNFGNDFVQAQVGSDGRFNSGLNELGSDNWYNTLFSWPASPWSSFTTLKVDGGDYIYGNFPDGEFTQSPTNLEDNSKNESVWKTGDISVKQVLQPGINPATGQPDALQVRYIITNTGTQDHEVGLRMMLDTMVQNNDSAPFKVPGQNGVESVDYERDYSGQDVPAFWQVFNDFDNPDISAQYSMSGGNATKPDRFTIANWGGISGTKWDYQITPGRGTGDSAVGMWWNPDTLSPGEQKVITTYYGRPGVGGQNALVLSGKKKLTFDEWSTSSFNLISYFTNNSASSLNNVRLVLEADPGINLVDHDPEHQVGTVNSGSTVQSSWKLRANTHGKHTITVKAFSDGSQDPFATATYEVEALEPVVPPNITLVGSNGTSADGTPIAGRVSPLTVNAAFDNPQAVGVTLVATDGNGSTYQHEMSSNNGVNWTHTFTPSAVGLWENPMTIKVIPRYANGTTGPAQEFPITLIDPSGFIYNENKGEDWRLPGATVVLQYFDPQIETWVNMSEEAYPGMMSPITNPQITGNDGRYAWDAAAGKYRVVVSRPGFETTTSREVIVPPPVTDLNVALKPTDNISPSLVLSGVTEGANSNGPVTANFSATDNEAGVRFITYKIDGNPVVTTNGDNATLPAVDSIGSHKITFTAVDQAGNETTKIVNFEISNSEDMLTLAKIASEKSKLAQTNIQAALSKINANAAISLVKEDLNKALVANDEAKVKITRLKELLVAYSGNKIPASQLEVLRKNIQTAEQQIILASNKLNQAISASSLATIKTLTNEALKANAYALNYVDYVKANIIAYGVK